MMISQLVEGVMTSDFKFLTLLIMKKMNIKKNLEFRSFQKSHSRSLWDILVILDIYEKLTIELFLDK